MCGIVGTIGKNIDKDFISNSIQSLKHRGPDSDSFWLSDDKKVFLGHTRLSIIDLSVAGNQPMTTQDKQGSEYKIVFNGEIYNYKQIKQELVDLKYKFESDSDTEVVLKAFIEWGKKCVEKFTGMFAFAIYNETQDKIYLFRDRFGVKPLYYYKDNNNFVFASELKAIFKYNVFEKQIDKQALSYYFQLGFIPAPHTIFNNTYKLEQGSWLEVNKDLNLQKEKYWSADKYFTGKYLDLSEDEVLQKLEQELLQSFQYRMVADVPVGVFLSGGIDSSLVVALLQKNNSQKIKTFTIGFDEKEYNEAGYAKCVAEALGTDHHEFYITSKQALEALEDYINVFDEPFGDSSGLPTYLLSKYTKEHVKVALSGDGGDELFAGYIKYEALWKLEKMSKLKKEILKLIFKILNPAQIACVYNLFARNKYSNLREKLAKLSQVLSADNLLDRFRLAGTYWQQNEVENLLIQKNTDLNIDFNQYFSQSDINSREQMQLSDLKLYLPDDILVKTDRSTMAVGLEGREPFLDENVLKLTAQINPDLKYKNLGSKYLLRQILYKHLDKDLVDRPKTGFRPPIYEWLKIDLADKLDGYLSQEKIKKQGIFDPAFVEKLLIDFRSDKYVNPDKVWLLLVFQMWYEKYFD